MRSFNFQSFLLIPDGKELTIHLKKPRSETNNNIVRNITIVLHKKQEKKLQEMRLKQIKDPEGNVDNYV